MHLHNTGARMIDKKDPSAILRTGFGFWESKALLTAVDFDLFTVLADKTMTGPELGEKLGIHPRGIWDFFDALVALGFLDRTGDGPESLYKNSEQSRDFLDKGSPIYIGGILEMLNDRLYRYWDDLGEALKTGKPQNEIKHGNKSMFEELYSDLPRLEQFMGAMSGLSRVNFEALADKFDFSPYKTLCDVGGATGLLSIVVAQRHSELSCLSFDLPAVEPIARKNIEHNRLSDRITPVSGNFFEDPLPKADVVTMGMILHDWNLENKMHLIRLAYEALPENGALIAVENIIDDARRVNTFGLLMSLNMLIEFGDAFDFTAADFRQWCTKAGFRKFDVLHLMGPCSAAIAYK